MRKVIGGDSYEAGADHWKRKNGTGYRLVSPAYIQYFENDVQKICDGYFVAAHMVEKTTEYLPRASGDNVDYPFE